MKIWKFLAVALLALFLHNGAQAQTTGKIAGTVTDNQGEALVGVNILIKGTQKGTATDLNGDYFLLNVRPGTYTIQASYIGFQTTEVQEVQVSVDRTTTIDITLQEEAFEGEEVVVTAQRSMVTKDQTSASSKVSGDEILKLPVDSFTESVSKQAGVTRGAGGSLHIRGGRSSEIKYYVDGVAVSNPFNNSLAVPVENTAVQEVEVISGTYNAEFGQANSGIVNIVTKDGTNEFTGTAISSVGGYFSTNDQIFYDIDEASPLGEQSHEVSFSGPILKDKLSFFSNFKYTNRDGYLYGREYFLPSDSSSFAGQTADQWIIESSGDSSAVPMNKSEGLTALGKLTWNLTTDLKVNYSLTYSTFEADVYGHAYRYNPYHQPTQYNESYNHLLAVNHVLSNRMFYNLRFTWYTTDFSQYVYEDPLDPRYSWSTGRSNQPSDVFSTGGVNNYWTDRESNTYAFRFDITRQIGNANLVKAGVELRYNDLDFREFYIQALRSNDLQPEIPDQDTRLNNDYVKNPIEAAAFLQDKIEIEDLIINVGVRFDYFDPNSKVPTDLRDPSNTQNRPPEIAYKDAEVKYQFSPRLGFAFPITDRGVIHASYGQFFQIPEYSRLYENPEFEVVGSTFSDLIGNADLDAQRSTTYEIGLQQELNRYVGIDLTTYYRDVRSLVGTRLYEARTGGDTWGRYENSDFGRVRGITLSTEIRTDIGVVGNINYTYQSARGNASDPRQAFLDAQNNNEATRNLLPLSWDQRHNISGAITFSRPNYNIGVQGTFHTGYPFTPLDENRQPLLELRNQARYESEFILDLRAAYIMDIQGIQTQLFLQAQNILDFYRDDRFFRLYRNDILSHQSIGKDRINSLREYRLSPTIQTAPRMIRVGAQVNF